jgi:hypothetical protein
MAHKARLAVVTGILVALGGCLEEPNRSQFGNGGEEPPPIAGNAAPRISGTPPGFVVEGELYDFTPSASDPDGDELEFSIVRKPEWATFDRTTGRLTGTPNASDVGNFTNISISVSDGEASASLSEFDISVNPIAAGQATLSWSPPTRNDDGSALTDLAGYRIYYGRNRDNLSQVIVINNPGLTRFVVENLTQARWYFSMTSVNSDGTESLRSALMSQTIS